MPKQIERLTEAQFALMLRFRDEWIKIGLSTEPADRPAAEEGVRTAYRIAGLEPPKRIVWCGSPLSQGLTRAIVFGLDRPEVGDSVWDSVWASVGASVWASVGASVGDSVGDSVWASVWDSVWASVGASVGDSVWASVGDSVGDSVRASVGDSVGDSVWASVNQSGFGQHDANWLAFYEYFRDACGLSEQTRRLAGLWQIARSAGWWLPHRNLCWISGRHNQLFRNAAGRLHREGGPALAYPDGWSIWALNGVRVPQWLAETAAEQLDPRKLLELKNAEHRREFVRRVGLERVCHSLAAKQVDVEGEYTLLLLDLGDGRRRPFLRMANPSVPECWHVEGVHPRCTTVQEALNFRNGLEHKTAEDGAEWYQQGDVLMFPAGATTFRPRPTVLT